MPGSDRDCTKPPSSAAEPGTATFTNGSTAFVGVGTHFTCYAVGDMIFDGAPGRSTINDAENVIAGITDDTHLTFALPYGVSNSLSTDPNVQFMRAAKWTPSNCGSIWFQMHQPNAPFAENFNYPNFAGHYATGSDNKTITPLTGWLLMALALADDDPRAVELLADTSAYFYDQTLSLTKQLQTGVSWTNPDYFND